MNATGRAAQVDIDGYRIVRKLGAGGMATVYLAQQTGLGRTVALKALAAEYCTDADAVTRFENEARTIARLDHPHIVSIYDVGRTSAGQIYYTMPYLPNGDLASRNLREDPLRVLEVMRALAEALGCAHDQGIVHRDVKPRTSCSTSSTARCWPISASRSAGPTSRAGRARAPRSVRPAT